MNFKKIKEEIKILENACVSIAISKNSKCKKSDFIGLSLDYEDYIGVEFLSDKTDNGFIMIKIHYDEIENYNIMSYTKREIINVVELFISTCEKNNEIAINQILNFSGKEFKKSLMVLEKIKIDLMFEKYIQCGIYRKALKDMSDRGRIDRNVEKKMRNVWIECDQKFNLVSNKKRQLERLSENILK